MLGYRHELVARHLAPATVNRRLAAIRSLTKLARLLGVVPWAIEVQDEPQGTLRDTRGPGVKTVAEMLRLAAVPRNNCTASSMGWDAIVNLLRVDRQSTPFGSMEQGILGALLSQEALQDAG